MRLRAEPTEICYCVEVDVDEFLAVDWYEDKYLIDETRPALFEVLDKIPGVRRTEYNGHFGSNFFFWLETAHQDELPRILKTMRSYIKRAKQNQRRALNRKLKAKLIS